MGFLGIGAMEALVILVIALIIFGPGRLPEMMSEAGRMVRDFRRATRELTGDFQDSMSEVRQTYTELEEDMRTTARDLRRDSETIVADVNTAVGGAADEAAGKSKATPRRQARPRLDQQPPESKAVDGEGVARQSPVSTGRSNRFSGKSNDGFTASNGKVEDSDDLLALEDGDDLLTVDER